MPAPRSPPVTTPTPDDSISSGPVLRSFPRRQERERGIILTVSPNNLANLF
jgi:hypothetical protein